MKIMDLFDLFRKGSAVTNVEAWKDGGNAATLLVPFFMAIVKVAGDYGFGIKLDTETATTIALGIVSAVQFVVHNVSSDKAGILPAKKPDAVAVPTAQPVLDGSGNPTNISSNVDPFS